jgi:hypothetical protein
MLPCVYYNMDLGRRLYSQNYRQKLRHIYIQFVEVWGGAYTASNIGSNVGVYINIIRDTLGFSCVGSIIGSYYVVSDIGTNAAVYVISIINSWEPPLYVVYKKICEVPM